MTRSKLNHISHDHPLVLISDFESSSIAAPVVCHICKTPIIGFSAAYTCSEEYDPCSFFLHKRCAESPTKIIHLLHPQHRLVLLYYTYAYARARYKPYKLFEIYESCAACTRKIEFDTWVYSCDQFCKVESEFNKRLYQYALCSRCAVMELVIDHEAHQHHPLTLLFRRACFSCDACGIDTQDFGSYTCQSCQFWIHSSCAASPLTIKLKIHEHDTLQLIYSIPESYRKFIKHCSICRNEVKQKYWAYFCEESGYFVHIKCAAVLLAAGKNIIEAEDGDGDGKTYTNLMQFPRPSTDSLIADLIAESGKLTINEVDNDKDHAIIHHQSHPEHKLILLEELNSADNRDDEENNTINCIDEMLVCNGCIQPISTASNKHYYGCIGCNFFLHISCAKDLPLQFSSGKCSRDPDHSMKLCSYYSPLSIDLCDACNKYTNGFTYKCETCDSTIIDICCCLAPDKIKHDYHKHPLVQDCHEDAHCNACLQVIYGEFIYRCETCPNIQIHQLCALSFPKTISHRWDSHSISLIYPPIYYKGLRYCEICEMEVNQEAWLYRCRECDQWFHPMCIRPPHNLKFGDTIHPSIHNLHSHTLTFKWIDKKRHPERIQKSLSCTEKCGDVMGHMGFYLECAGCNYLLCLSCAAKGGTGDKSLVSAIGLATPLI